ncbi:hypothetical protein BC940DRAFT_288743 [Gongronella butleri]|nr:hypothetical protein BC940DRAFT_288743 [Gongronella butleri]
MQPCHPPRLQVHVLIALVSHAIPGHPVLPCSPLTRQYQQSTRNNHKTTISTTIIITTTIITTTIPHSTIIIVHRMLPWLQIIVHVPPRRVLPPILRIVGIMTLGVIPQWTRILLHLLIVILIILIIIHRINITRVHHDPHRHGITKREPRHKKHHKARHLAALIIAAKETRLPN